MISNGEMDRRWSATRAIMAQEGIDWLIATSGNAFGFSRWLTNRTGLAGPLAAIGMDGDVLFASHGDEVHHQPFDSYGVHHVASCAQLALMANTQAPLLVEEIRRRGSPKTIGLLAPGFIPVAADRVLHEAFPDAKFVDATDQIARLKAIKSPEEMGLIRQTAAMHDEGVEIARRMLRPGITARDVVEEVRSYFTRNGSPIQTMMGGSAPRDQICRYSGPIERKLESGDLFAMLIECAGPDGYYSETMPTMCLGEPPKHLQTAFDHASEIQNVLVDRVRPGMLPSELIEINDVLMAKHGYPPEGRLLGHSQGLDLVERPGFSPLGENLTIEHDMVISIHPTVHTANAWGFPNNLSFHFTANGMERLLKTPQEVFVVA